MDMYALARIFKPYNIKKNNPAGAFQPRESKNIIIYAGNNHAKNYVEFLEYLRTIGREVTLLYRNIGTVYTSCVKIIEGEPSQIEPEKPPVYLPPINDRTMDYYPPSSCSIL